MFEVKGNIWIEGPNGTLMGIGRMTLLSNIDKFGSISEAARSMGMSYRRAWESVDAMNKEARKVLVTTSSGGVGGGGASVTDEGRQILEHFNEVQKRFEKFKKQETRKLDF